MNGIMEIIKEFTNNNCECGVLHETAIKDIQVASGIVGKVGDILRKNNFSKKLLLVADKNTLKASDGIIESLRGFDIEYRVYDDIRVAQMHHVEELEKIIDGRDISILSVGTGSVNDPCRLAAARRNKKLCIFATAPSMDGFASYSSPIVKDGFKSSYPAKSPEVIIADTKILADSPNELKSAGFGDMVAKYVGLVDWQISSLLTGEYYCARVADLTRDAVDRLMKMADKVTLKDEETAKQIFEALLMTGIGMSFVKNSRPASGSEHIISHLVECKELQKGIIPNYHGKDIGVCTLETLKYYEKLAGYKKVSVHRENADWDSIYEFYGSMSESVKELNTPDTIADGIDCNLLEKNWQKIRDIIHSVPSYNECKAAMIKAGCAITIDDIGKDRKFFYDCMKYSPYMRRRLTLLRIAPMIEAAE